MLINNYPLRQKMILAPLSIIVMVVSTLSVTVQAATLCNDLTHEDYAKGIDRNKHPEQHYTYGIEVEYSIDDAAPALFEAYAPAESLMKLSAWKRLSIEDKRSWLKANKEKLFPDGPKAKSLLLRVDPQDLTIPDHLIVDETGNVELISPRILENTLEFHESIQTLKTRFGEGYVQASMGLPAHLFYKSRKQSDAFIGLRFILGEYDILSKLHEAYEKHVAIPEYIPSKNFTHPYLGPMTSSKANFLKNVFRMNRLGFFDKDVIDRIAKKDASYKYTSQIVYRPDIIRSHEVFLIEVRQCVKDFDCLQALLRRERFFLRHDISKLSRFKEVPHLDPIADYHQIPKDTQKMLETVFPRKNQDSNAAENLANDIYRNFAYPLADWESWLKTIGISRSDIGYNVLDRAKTEYLSRINTLADLFNRNSINDKQAANEVRIALAKFVKDSNLKIYIENYLIKNFGRDLKELL